MAALPGVKVAVAMPLESIHTTRASVSIENIYASKGRQKGRSPEPPALEYAGKAGVLFRQLLEEGVVLFTTEQVS